VQFEVLMIPAGHRQHHRSDLDGRRRCRPGATVSHSERPACAPLGSSTVRSSYSSQRSAWRKRWLRSWSTQGRCAAWSMSGTTA